MQQTTQHTTIIGLDISKDKIDCCIDSNGEQQHLIITNDQDGWQHLYTYLPTDTNSIHACCEATNTYWRGIAHYLHSHHIKISVTNPSSIKAYAKLMLKRIKTDKQDSRLIAAYCRQYRPEAWQPDAPAKAALKSLYRRCNQLTQILVAEKVRLQTADGHSRPSVERIINIIRAELADCQNQMQNLIEQDDNLKQQQTLLQTIPGIGKQTARILLAVTSELHKYPTAKHLISWLGLSPVIKQSGKWQGAAKVSKMGDKSLRKALYMPARAACTRSKLWRGWFDYQIRRGKHPKQIYVMMMAKLVKYAYACLKADKPFDAALHSKRLELMVNT